MFICRQNTHYIYCMLYILLHTIRNVLLKCLSMQFNLHFTYMWTPFTLYMLLICIHSFTGFRNLIFFDLTAYISCHTVLFLGLFKDIFIALGKQTLRCIYNLKDNDLVPVVEYLINVSTILVHLQWRMQPIYV